MKCMHVNIRKASMILLSFLINHIHHSQLFSADNHMDLTTKDQSMKNSTNNDSEPFHAKPSDGILHCPTDAECSKLMEIPSCIDCKFDHSCVYGEPMNVSCHVHNLLQCKGQRSFERTLLCRYCYQTEPWEHSCDLKADCNSVTTPRSNYQTNCTVHDDVLCLGLRTFNKNLRCNWTRGYRWSTALALSITLGGFGADRFYLGHWQEGIGKLFSFGGLGVWTLIDVILISLHYLGPADGSLYI